MIIFLTLVVMPNIIIVIRSINSLLNFKHKNFDKMFNNVKHQTSFYNSYQQQQYIERENINK